MTIVDKSNYTETDAIEDLIKSRTSESDVERLVMPEPPFCSWLCAYCPKDAKVPADHIFETSTGAETATCKQHANIALTCMKHLRRVGT